MIARKINENTWRELRERPDEYRVETWKEEDGRQARVGLEIYSTYEEALEVFNK